MQVRRNYGTVNYPGQFMSRFELVHHIYASRAHVDSVIEGFGRRNLSALYWSIKTHGKDTVETPKNYGKSEGYDTDDSDTVWGSHILCAYGELAASNARHNEPGQEEDDYDIPESFAGALQMYDTYVGEQFLGEATEEDDNLGGQQNQKQEQDPVINVDNINNPPPRGEEHELVVGSDVDERDIQPPGEDVPEEQEDDSTGDARGEDVDRDEYGADDSDDEEVLNWNQGDAHQMSAEEAYLRDTARTPLFHNSRVSLLSTVILLMNCLRMHGASAALISELFTLLSKVILPALNSLPTSEYEANKMLKKLGLKYGMIDVCPNQCMLFRGPEYGELESCPKCNAQRRRKSGKSMVARRVLCYFPLIPRIVRYFKSPVLTAALAYAGTHQSTDEKMRIVADSDQWRFVDQNYHDFGAEPRNIRLVLGIDGINPFSEKQSTYSIWPVILLNYNVAPWFTLKKFFVLLSVIIPGKKSVSGEHFDMYIEPLLEEL